MRRSGTWSNAFFAAARAGDFDGLVAVLDPDVVLRSDGGARRPEASQVHRGVTAVAGRAVMFSQPGALVRPVLVNGTAEVVVTAEGAPDLSHGLHRHERQDC